MRITRPAAARSVVSPQRVVRALALAVALACAGGAAHAAGLGNLQVLSGLGQPLRAEIELTAVTPEESGNLRARLAPLEAYNRARVDYSPALSSLRFAIERRPNGREVIRITSAVPINEPFLELLIELSGGAGRLVREYTFLLDPPELRTARQDPVAPLAAPVTAAPATPAAPIARPVAPPAPAPVTSAGAAAAALAARSNGVPAPYRVQAGDTLVKIARSMQPPGVTLEQMLVGLLRNNPAAFEGQNMNRLRAGAILRAPAQDTLTAVTPAEASRIFTAQTSDFANYRRSVATRAGEAPLVRAPEASREASGRITAQVQDQTATADASRDRVMLSRATEAPAAAAAGAAGRPGPTAEDAALRDRALQEADTRVALLEKTVADLQKLIELKNQNLQELQRLAESQGKALPPLAALGQTPGASTPGGSGVGGLPQAPASSPRAAVVPAGSTSLVNDLMANPLALGGGVAILLLIAALTAYNLRRKRKFAGFEDSNLTGHSSLHANSVFGVAGGGSVDTRNSGFNSNFVPQGGVASDSNEVDPVAEADVYIAYGRDAQAEEILREALRNQPERIAVRLKLLELFAKREDVAEFEVIATELHTTTGGAGPDWEFAAKLGAKIDPQNVLYRIEGDVSGEGAAQSPNGHPAGSSGGMVTTAAVLASGVIGEAAAEAKTSSSPAQGQGFQNTLPMTPAPDGHADTAKVRDEAGADKDEIAAPQDLDFDLTFDAPPTAAEAPTPASSAASSAAEATEAPNFMPALDFDLDLTTPPDVKPATAATAATAATVVAPSDPATPQLEPLAFDPVPAETSGNAAKDAGSETSGAAANESALDFEFDLELPDAPAADVAGSKGGAPASASMDETSSEMGQSSSADKSPLADISFDLDIDTAADMEAPIAASGDSADQSPADAGREMATKLDLAAAYRDIGDTDGARELLEEVIKGGDSTQIEQANELLKSLA